MDSKKRLASALHSNNEYCQSLFVFTLWKKTSRIQISAWNIGYCLTFCHRRSLSYQPWKDQSTPINKHIICRAMTVFVCLVCWPALVCLIYGDSYRLIVFDVMLNLILVHSAVLVCSLDVHSQWGFGGKHSFVAVWSFFYQSDCGASPTSICFRLVCFCCASLESLLIFYFFP